VRLTLPLLKLLSALLAEPAQDRYGLDLMKVTGLPSGTLYPMLQRLEQAGWIESQWESIEPAVEGRPARKYYRITPTGISSARSALAELHAATTPPLRVPSKASLA
jgi:PadR family transcriptional regulator, regulatory protein PadR